MIFLKSRIKNVSCNHVADWNKYDDRLMKAAERGDVEKVSSILAKKGVNPGKLDVEGRSVFHVVASKGNLECLNAILLHGVDITTSDTAGRNALHLAAKYGHALCLQKLLQYNCPTEHVDLQGRTALHDAAMADCTSSIQLLCDHGASVNARDVDGRTPLVLATQMCRPTLCQMLIDRGADINSRDKQNRTALMLGCEYGCKDAVEVLIKNGADVSLLDALGHDSSYYARIGDNLDILTLLKTASENTNKESVYLKSNKDIDYILFSSERKPSISWRENTHPPITESQQCSDRYKEKNIWYLPLQRIPVAIGWRRAKGGSKKVGKNQKSREESRKGRDLEIENEDLKERLRKIQQEQIILLDKVNGLQLQLNEEVMVADDLESEADLAVFISFHFRKCTLVPDSKGKSDHLASGSHFSNRPGRHQATTEQNNDSDEQIKQLEDALKDVQKRMYESEGKVKQMQTHFLALKEHLTSEAATGNSRLTEELKDQLKDMKAKYEGASAEVGKLRNQIRQNEMLVEEFKREEGKLIEENKRLQKEFSMCEMEQEKKEREVTEMEGQLKELVAKLALSVPTEKFENMKSLLSNEVNEKAKKLVEMEREYEKSLSEIRPLKRELENLKAKLAQHVKPEEHEQLKSRLEQKSGELGKKITELTSKNQMLQKEIEKIYLDNKLLNQQAEYISLKEHEEKMSTVSKSLKKAQGNSAELLANYNKGQEEIARLHAEIEAQKKELDTIQECIKLKYTPIISFEECERKFKAAEKELKKEQQTVTKLHQMLENQKNSSVPLVEHLQIKEAFEKEVGIIKASLKEKEEESQNKTEEVSKLQSEVHKTKQALKKLETRESSIEQEIKDQKERCDKSLTTITELQRRIQDSAKQIEAKDNKKITELLNDVERLKQALSGISQLTHTSASPRKRQSQLVETLQHQVKSLQQQLADADRQHQEVIAIYRTHLLSAAQGHMDEDVQAALLQIIQM
uniref:Uveal autoantigen with coiled-coil domains and ankyrin repeats n=1 Tax=Loxodonta africana TaxID=9785 RepID=G3TRP2_LOXAF